MIIVIFKNRSNVADWISAIATLLLLALEIISKL